MILVKQINYKKSHKDFNELNTLCFLSKNLYNSTLYRIREHFFKTGEYLNYYVINKLFIKENQKDYRALPSKVSQHTQMLVDKNFKSFFALLKKKKDGKYEAKIKIPSYLNKANGKQVVLYDKSSLSFKKEGYIHLSKTNIFIKSDFNKEDVKFIRIVPKNNLITIEIGYEKEEKPFKDNGKFASIDLGLNNLMTVVTSVNEKPLIINGLPLKSINQRFNKRNAKIKSELFLKNQKYHSKKLYNVINKRNNKVKDYLHKSSTFLVNYLVSNNITNLIIGYNENWKQNINLSKKNNQNFVSIPFYTLINQIQYKCKLKGINVILINEAYTSKCSFLDNEEIKKHNEYLGIRIKRGLFKRKINNQLVNADVNSACNILKKYLLKEVAKNSKDIYNSILENLVKVCSVPCDKIKTFI